jgi:hypothetical protein
MDRQSGTNFISAIAACWLLAGTAAADDILTTITANLPPQSSPPLTEAVELRGGFLLSTFGGASIDFVEGGSLGDIGDNVTFPSFNVRLFSDTENTSHPLCLERMPFNGESRGKA